MNCTFGKKTTAAVKYQQLENEQYKVQNHWSAILGQIKDSKNLQHEDL